MDILEFYSSQSPFTDPGRNVQMYEGLPASASDICKVVDGICLDFNERWKYPIQNERWLETNNRYVDEFLDSVRRLNKTAPITEERPAEQKMMTSVSHVASMCVSMLRHVGIPARKRVGFIKNGEEFATYEIVEYYDAADSSWKTADPNGKCDGFISAAQAFCDVRSGKEAAEKYTCDDTYGIEVVVNNLILDLSAVNKKEMLSWDRYGWMCRPVADYSDRAWELLEEAADVLANDDRNIDRLQAVYCGEEGFMVPRIIFCDSPIVPPHKAVIR